MTQPTTQAVSLFAADGVTPIYTAHGLPIMVSAVEFNRVHSELAALRAELARPQEVTDAEVYRAKALIGFADNEPTRRALQDFLANRAATSTKPADSAAVPCEPVGHLYTIAGVQHCTIQKVLPDGPLYTTPQAPTAQPLAPVQQNQATGGSIWDIGRMGIYGAAPSIPLKEGV